MKIAIIGGGASGLITAYLLNRVHEVHLFEKEPILGGNVRTLNGNVLDVRLDRHVVIENGVLGFNLGGQPRFLKLLRQLGVEVYIHTPGSGMFLADGRRLRIPRMDALGLCCIAKLWGVRRELAQIGLHLLAYLARTWRLSDAHLAKKRFSRYLGNRSTVFATWLRGVAMEALSLPYSETADLPAEIAVPLTRMCLRHPRWYVIKDGTYAYMQKILDLLDGEVFLDAEVVRVSRDESGARVGLRNGRTRTYDKVVFATTPDRVLSILADPSDRERSRFGAWRENRFETVAHTDTLFYEKWQTGQYSETDFFEKSGGDDFGYNCCMNHLRQIPAPVYYSFAHNMGERIRPDRIIDVHEHRTPGYTLEAVSHRREIIETNGQNHTYHVGAYLGDGLHEEALASACRVSRLLGAGGRARD